MYRCIYIYIHTYIYIYIHTYILKTHQLNNLGVTHLTGWVFFWPCVRAHEKQVSFFHHICCITLFIFSITLFSSWNFFCTYLVDLSWKHWRYISRSQKSAWWRTVGFFVSFINHVRIVNPICISKEKAVRHHVDLMISLLNFSWKISKLPRVVVVGGGSVSIKDVQKWGLLRPKLDVCG